MIKPPQNLTALDGKDATISCNAQGAPAPNITWFFNGKFFFYIKPRSLIPKNHNILFNDIFITIYDLHLRHKNVMYDFVDFHRGLYFQPVYPFQFFDAITILSSYCAINSPIPTNSLKG